MTEKINWDECPIGAVVPQKLDAIHAQLVDLNKKVEKQNGRIRALENWRWFVTGIAFGVPFLINWVFSVMGK